MKAMIFAAGLGTRLRPLTDNKPKALVEINGVSLLELVIRRLISFDYTDIIVNVHHFSDDVISFLQSKNNFGVNITISDERDMLLDTGGGLQKAAWFFNDNKPFLVHNVDVISNIDLTKMYDFHCESNGLATLAVMQRETSRYFLFNSQMELCGWKNITTNELISLGIDDYSLSLFAFSGIHIIDPKIFQYIDESGKFSMTNVYLKLANKHIIKGFAHNESWWMDLGKPEAIKKAEQLINQI